MFRSGKFRAEREIEGAREVVEGCLPAVITAQKGLNTPRYAALKGIMAAKKKQIDIRKLESLGLSADDLQPRLAVQQTTLPPPTAAREDPDRRCECNGAGTGQIAARGSQGHLGLS